MKTLRIISYAGLVAVAIMLLVAMCAILQDSMISRRAHRQELTGSTLSSPGSLDRFSSVAPHRFSDRKSDMHQAKKRMSHRPDFTISAGIAGHGEASLLCFNLPCVPG
ncbi:hypothetical protein P3T23_008763 [Paraburkholderia sp. GAS448]|jgi:hypothetical protein|uniref:hypothetical protein n=1 Tax=Paraburkholderia sp. GAS448 TaxID=3035136 RepID=UPI003D19832B